MYRAFNLAEIVFKQTFIDEGAASFFTNKNIVEKALSDFLKNGTIDGTKLRGHWFPDIKADVFISHSHKDQTDAKNLAGFLRKKFGLTSFIDSCVWLYSDDLLKQIDLQYCTDDGGKTYSYENRNGSTTHVHMMLATALGEMLDSAECAIFMNTPNSITSQNAVSKTHSPWIYYELGMIKLIRENVPKRLRLIKEALVNMSRASREMVPIDYAVDLSALTEINSNHLNNWDALRQKEGRDVHSLDLLYRVAAGKA